MKTTTKAAAKAAAKTTTAGVTFKKIAHAYKAVRTDGGIELSSVQTLAASRTLEVAKLDKANGQATSFALCSGSLGFFALEIASKKDGALYLANESVAIKNGAGFTSLGEFKTREALAKAVAAHKDSQTLEKGGHVLLGEHYGLRSINGKVLRCEVRTNKKALGLYGFRKAELAGGADESDESGEE